MRRNPRITLLALLCATGVPAAQAGGPLYIHEASKQPVAWPNATSVKVYTDLGSLGKIDNAATDAMVAKAFAEWTQVPTSDFEAAIAGDFTAVGLPDITAQNAGTVVGKDNGGGIHVVYDQDGTLMQNFFGVDSSILGIASPEWGDGPVVTESWIVFNGAPAMWTPPEQLQGAFTHEVGHSIGLAHSQTNGEAAQNDVAAAFGCTAPYPTRVPAKSVETMFPRIQTWSTGIPMGTVDMRDDRVAVSNLYPAAGWPASGGSISGRVYAADGTTELTGVNVVARNLDNPHEDAVSAISGDQTQGLFGADGRFTFNGLTPGANYVVYVDRLNVPRSYATPAAYLVYGDYSEEFWNAAESGDAATDPRCDSTPLQPTAGTTLTANISINRPTNVALLTVLPVPGFVATDLSDDGSILVGTMPKPLVPGEEPAYYPGIALWTEAEGIAPVPNTLSTGGAPQISGAGDTVYGGFEDANGISQLSRWRIGDAEPTRLSGGMAIGICDSSGASVYGSAKGGDVLVGLAFRASSKQCAFPFAFRWTEAKGFEQLGGMGPTTRANAISEDGSTVAGWNDGHAIFQGRQGVWWYRGRQSWASPSPGDVGQYWGAAYGTSGDGAVIVGGYAGASRAAWVSTRTGQRRLIPQIDVPFADPFRAGGLATHASSDGSAVLGFWGDTFERRVFLWTETLGVVGFAEFLHSQGAEHVKNFQIRGVSAISPDDKHIVGFGWANGATVTWTTRLDSVAMCSAAGETHQVSFPKGMDAALVAGSRVGRCDLPDPSEQP